MSGCGLWRQPYTVYARQLNAKIRKYLSQDTCEILVHAFISSKLDHCNSLLHGLPKYLLARLQAVLNAAACVVTADTEACSYNSYFN